MAAIFSNHTSIARIYFHSLAPGVTVMSLKLIENTSDTAAAILCSSEVNVTVHTYGATALDVLNPTMYSTSTVANRKEILCGSRMILDVSEWGIIGRGISISSRDGKPLGHGVIGWNE